MIPFDDIHSFLHGEEDTHHVPCPDCGGQGWHALWTSPPEQVQCERCWGSGYVPEHSLTEHERVAREEAHDALADWDTTLSDGLPDEEEDHPEGLLDDGVDADDEDLPPGVSS